MKLTRHYNEEYLQYGFTKWVDSNGNDRAQSLICDDILVNESLKPSKLKRHLEKEHNELSNKPVKYFQRKKKDLQSSVKVLCQFTTVKEKALLSSYLTAYSVAKEKLPHTLAEKVILL